MRSTITALEQASLRDAVNASPNTLFVVSAGNSANSNDATPRYPCNLDAPNLLCVGSSDHNDALASFSNYGAKSVDLVAPGAKIYTVNGRSTYGYFDGTSYSTPLVAGVAALYLARYPQATISEVKNAVLGGVDAKPAFAGRTVTGGRLNAVKTLAIPAGPPPPPPPPLTPPPPPPVTRPSVGDIALRIAKRQKLSTVLRRGLRVSVRLPVAARLQIRIRISRTQARRLRTSTVIGSAIVRRSSGNQSVRVRIRASARRLLRKQRRMSLRVMADISALNGTSPAVTKRTVRSVLLLRTLGSK